MANPNPSPKTRFKPGQAANPGGKTAEQAARDAKTADLASRFRERVLSTVMEKVEAGEDILDLLTADVIRIAKDSEDRAHGTPKQTIAGAGEDGEHLHKVSADEAFQRIASRLASATPGTAGSPDSAE